MTEDYIWFSVVVQYWDMTIRETLKSKQLFLQWENMRERVLVSLNMAFKELKMK